jgi:endonuclease YncB( thermonuclease family)
MISQKFPTGADCRLWLGEWDRPPDGFGETQAALSARSISISEEDASTPLFHWSRDYPDLFARGRRAVSGLLVLNYEVGTNRQIPPERFWGKTIWARMEFVEYGAQGASAVEETIRIGPVYPRPFTHAPEGREAGYATDQVPFLAREIKGAARNEMTLEMQNLLAQVDPTTSSQSGLVRSESRTERATVTKIIDGDTFRVGLPSGENQKIRFEAIQAPEIYKPDNPKVSDGGVDDNQERAKWKWPLSAPSNAGEAPTKSQLAEWGLAAKDWLARELGANLDSEGNVTNRPEVTLKRGPAQPDTGKYDRQVRQVKAGGEDLGLKMVEAGYAVPNPTGSSATLEGGEYQWRGRKLKEAYREARSNAGTEDARGVWRSHEAQDL